MKSPLSIIRVAAVLLTAVLADLVYVPTASAQSVAATASAQSVSLPAGYAAAAFQAPVGFGTRLGSVGFGVYGQMIDNAEDDFDGSAAVTVGLGDPGKWFGLDVSAVSSSLSGSSGAEDGFGEAGSFGVKLHTNLPRYISLAVGVQSFRAFGAAEDANQSSLYAAGSKFFKWDGGGMMFTVGAGDGSFDHDANGLGAFGSLAWYIDPRFSLIAEYSGRYANAALSFAPFASQPLTITLGAVNLNDRYDLGTQGALSVAYGFSLL